jgi:hypothetical protein
VRKNKDALHLALNGTPRSQRLRDPNELVLEDRAKAQIKRQADPHSKVRVSHAKKVSKARLKVRKFRCAKFNYTRAKIEEAWLGVWEREIARFDWQVSIKQSKFTHIPTQEQRKAVADWVANGRKKTPTSASNVPGWDEMCAKVSSPVEADINDTDAPSGASN